jgi:hypothetical protein
METNPLETVPQRNTPEGSSNWEARKPFILGKEHFEFQMDFAKILQSKTSESLLQVIKGNSPLLRRHVYEFGDDLKIIGLRQGVTEENILDFAYIEYTEATDTHVIPYHEDGGHRYGCFSYDVPRESTGARIHFANAEFDTTSPLDNSKYEQRKLELKDVLQDIKSNSPDIQEIQGLSWLYNLSAYCRLFPQSYIDNVVVEDDPFQWARGTTIWGQFVDHAGNLKQESADELLRRMSELPVGEPLSALFGKDSPILPPLKTWAPIEDFYIQFGIL